MSQENVSNRQLQELSHSDYEIADGQPDIKGWDVKDESGKNIGEVKDLLFDETSRKVRYLIVDFDGNDFDLDDRKVLVPIGIANLHQNDDDVILPGVTASQLQSLPSYEKGNLTTDTEHSIRNAFAGIGGAAVAGNALTSKAGTNVDDVFYDHDHFNEDNLYRNRMPAANTTETNSTEIHAGETIPVIKEELQVGKREVETGRIRLRSRIVETPVQEDISLREERVQVERIPVDRPANAADIKEESIELTETAEVPVVSKEARVVEEVSLDKDVREEEQTVTDTVRNTEVDIEDIDKPRNTNTGTNSI